MGKNVKITHVSASSVGRLVGTVNALFAFATGLIGSVVAISDVVAMNNYSFLMNVGISAAIILGGIVVLPMVAFLFGWLYGALAGFVWNVFLGAAGGVDMTIEDVVDKK